MSGKKQQMLRCGVLMNGLKIFFRLSVICVLLQGFFYDTFSQEIDGLIYDQDVSFLNGQAPFATVSEDLYANLNVQTTLANK